METIDAVAIVVFLCCFAGYHGSYFIVHRFKPEKTIKSHANFFRMKGIEFVLRKGDHLLLIQQLRDVIYVSNLLASSTLIFIGILLNLLINLRDLAKSLGIVDVETFELKILFIATIQAASFMFFISSLRYYRLVSLFATTPPEVIKDATGEEAHEYLGRLLNRGCSFYTLGSNCLVLQHTALHGCRHYRHPPLRVFQGFYEKVALSLHT
ncbi:DUF599 domain-containing protein [Archaeoglobus veneficus]|uniref:Uncharacterized protein n=1 Tax=Archaeoglobus veneficus (strain DSM 11195 / SNP6) TaxID=693661 RepID=F2KN97_ARCVS|nr:DUF599 domain-containing protein [Archaeoglobus veneficus]AEA46198.1 protein of unknown function DUF599 [Archaeoglobus veneficus SNP6]